MLRLELPARWPRRCYDLRLPFRPTCKRGKLIVRVSDTTPPFTFRNRAKPPVGTISMSSRWRGGRGRCRLVSVASAERIPMSKDGRLDFVATSMTRTPERLKEIDFNYIYFVTPHAVIVKKSAASSVGQVAGRKPHPPRHRPRAATWRRPARHRDRYARLRHVRRPEGQQGRRLPDRRERAARSCSRTASRRLSVPSDFTKSRNVGFALKKDEPRFPERSTRRCLTSRLGRSGQIFDAWFTPIQEPMAQVQDPSGLG